MAVSRDNLLCSLVLMIVLVAGCKQKAKPKPEWLQETTVRAVGARSAFEGTTQVTVEIVNQTDGYVSLERLERSECFASIDDNGKRIAVDPLSLGAGKPISAAE